MKITSERIKALSYWKDLLVSTLANFKTQIEFYNRRDLSYIAPKELENYTLMKKREKEMEIIIDFINELLEEQNEA